MQDARFSRTCLLSLYESEANTNEVKEVPAEAAESMLNYIYSGKVSEDPNKLTLDLLNIAS